MKYQQTISLLIGCTVCAAAQTTDQTETTNIVTANRFEQEKKELNSAISLFQADSIMQRLPQSLDDLLRGEPNIEFSGGPRLTGQQLEIRGQGGNAITVRIDGARQNFVSGHAGQRFFVDPLFLNSGEIIRGAKSHLYGSGAAGVVNLRTYNPSDLINPETGFGGKLQAGFQGVNDELSTSGLFAAGTDKYQALFGYVRRDSNDIRLGNGLRSEGSASQRQSGLLKLSLTPTEDHELIFGYNYYESKDTNGANPQADASLSNALVDRNIDFHQATLGYKFNPEHVDWLDLGTSLYYNRTTQERRYNAASGSNFGRVNEHVIETLGIDIVNKSIFDAFGAENTLISGFEYFQDKQVGKESRADFNTNGIPGTSSGRPNADADSAAFYLENNMNWDNGFTFTTGLRYDNYSTTGRNSDQSDGQFSPHIGVRYEVTDGFAIYADYSRAFTAPTLNEIYQEGSHFGVVPGGPGSYFEEVFVSNSDLKSQTSDNFEIGFDINKEIHGGEFSSKISWFQQNGEDTFDTQIIGGNTVPSYVGFMGPGTLNQAFRQSFNRDETTIMGVEADLNYSKDNWYARMTYSYLEGEDDSTGENLNTIPGNKLYFETGYTYSDKLTIGVNALFAASREGKVNEDSVKTSAYDIYGLFATYDYNDSLSLTAGVNNLLDQSYERTNTSNTETGRNIYVGATYKF